MTHEFDEGYKCYVIANSVLATQHKAVQISHAIATMCHRWKNNPILNEWVSVDKTIIFLDGGVHGTMIEDYQTLITLCRHLYLPHDVFVEDEYTMNCMTTAICCVVPYNVYNADKLIDLDSWDKDRWTIINENYELSLHTFLKAFPLAR